MPWVRKHPAVSPDAPRRGEWSAAHVVYQNQIAATLCAFLGIDYSEENPRAGKPMTWMLSP